MKTCPNCAQSWYDCYANGTWEEGYCQACSYEVKELCTKVSNLPKIILSQRPKSDEAKKTKPRKRTTD